MTKVFIDGSAGTTGLRIYERLGAREDLTLVTIEEKFRKDVSARAEALNSVDVAFLCLPDDAAKESVSLISNPNVIVIDTSTAHRTNPDWTYGFAEVNGLREKIACSKRIANPGCHASGFIALVAPLVNAGIISQDAYLSCFSITGYTGGGKKMIAQYQENADPLLSSPRIYALAQTHKHLPEMKKVCSLLREPVFSPIVAPFACGMQVTVPIFKDLINGTFEQVKDVYRSIYNTRIVHFDDNADENGFTSSSKLAGYDDMQISVFGNEDRFTLCARFDNLGKGASGSAIQNMNIALGLDETEGLNL